jgi:hypothetical protein
MREVAHFADTVPLYPGRSERSINFLLGVRIKVSFIAILAIVAACSTVRPLSTTRTLDGYPAKAMTIILLDAYSFKPGFVTHTLPAGTYAPVLEDNNGISNDPCGPMLPTTCCA